MMHLQAILAAASLVAGLGGTVGVERLLDRYARIPAERSAVVIDADEGSAEEGEADR